MEEKSEEESNQNDTSVDEDFNSSVPKSNFSKFLLSYQISNQPSTHNDAIKLLAALRKLEIKGKEEMASTTILKTLSGLYSELLKKKEKTGLFFFWKLVRLHLYKDGGK